MGCVRDPVRIARPFIPESQNLLNHPGSFQHTQVRIGTTKGPVGTLIATVNQPKDPVKGIKLIVAIFGKYRDRPLFRQTGQIHSDQRVLGYRAFRCDSYHFPIGIDHGPSRHARFSQLTEGKEGAELELVDPTKVRGIVRGVLRFHRRFIQKPALGRGRIAQHPESGVFFEGTGFSQFQPVKFCRRVEVKGHEHSRQSRRGDG